MSTNTSQLSGLLNIYKPSGPTSHDIVAKIRRVLQPPKVGHAGTLDPFAEGVLLVALGSATRLIRFTHSFDKEYEAAVIFGQTSTTDDRTGILTPYPDAADANPPDRAAIEAALKHFRGSIRQTPPAFSAVKVAGKPMYALARAGKMTEALAGAGERTRQVTIYDLKILRYAYPRLEIFIRASTGTYIRALARDLGAALRQGAYVESLKRTRIGPFEAKNSILPDKLSTASLPNSLIKPNIIVEHLPSVILGETDVAQLKQGREVVVKQSPVNAATDTPVAIFDSTQSLVGIGSLNPSTLLLRPTINLN